MTVTPINDDNYEFAGKMFDALLCTLGNPNLGAKPLEVKEWFYEDTAKVIVETMSRAADAWYTPHSRPRTVMIAIVVNTLNEHLDRVGVHKDSVDFWIELAYRLDNEFLILEKKAAELQPGDKMNVDEYHKEVEDRLNA